MDYSRNWLFINPKTQDKLKNTRILVVGLGIGSLFSELCVRTGIGTMTICDGDKVDISNLNRQNYTTLGIGNSKAKLCKERLLSINPDLNLTVLDCFADESLLVEEISKHDFIINTIDFDAPEFYICTNLTQKLNKIELFPINLGFGCAVCIFDQSTPSWHKFFPKEENESLKNNILKYLVSSPILTPYLKETARQYFMNESKKFDPQLGISCYLVSSLMMTLIVSIVSGEGVYKFPDFHYLDARAPNIIRGFG